MCVYNIPTIVIPILFILSTSLCSNFLILLWGIPTYGIICTGKAYGLRFRSFGKLFIVQSLCVLNLVLSGRTDIIQAEDPKSPVPQEVLREISGLLRDGICMPDIIDRLRCHTVPNGYKFHTWRQGTTAYTVQVCNYNCITRGYRWQITSYSVPVWVYQPCQVLVWKWCSILRTTWSASN